MKRTAAGSRSCKLDIFHSTPSLKTALLLTLLGETEVETDSKRRIIMIKTDFKLMETSIDAYFLIALSPEFRERLAVSMTEATKIMTEGRI